MALRLGSHVEYCVERPVARNTELNLIPDRCRRKIVSGVWNMRTA